MERKTRFWVELWSRCERKSENLLCENKQNNLSLISRVTEASLLPQRSVILHCAGTGAGLQTEGSHYPDHAQYFRAFPLCNKIPFSVVSTTARRQQALPWRQIRFCPPALTFAPGNCPLVLRPYNTTPPLVLEGVFLPLALTVTAPFSCHRPHDTPRQRHS